MYSHIITVEDLEQWMQEKTVLFASSSAEPKRLEATLKGEFLIIHNHVEIWKGLSPDVAIEKYNEIDKFTPKPKRKSHEPRTNKRNHTALD